MPREWDLNRRVAVRKLPEDAITGDILELFDRFGKVRDIFIARSPPGFAFLEYERRRDAEAAASEGNGIRYRGASLSVELTIRELDKTVVISNLKSKTTKQQIRQVFAVYGTITKIWVEQSRRKGAPLMAFVEYKRSRDAKEAVRATDGKNLCGCFLSVNLPRKPKPPSSNPQRRSRHSTIESSTNDNASHRAGLETNQCDSTTGRNVRARCNPNAVSSSSKQRLDCCVCTRNSLENTPTSAPCGHVFCGICIKRAIQRDQKCPVCSRALEIANLTRMLPS